MEKEAFQRVLAFLPGVVFVWLGFFCKSLTLHPLFTSTKHAPLSLFQFLILMLFIRVEDCSHAKEEASGDLGESCMLVIGAETSSLDRK